MVSQQLGQLWDVTDFPDGSQRDREQRVELKNYLRIVAGKWWLVLITFVSAVAFTYVFTDNQPLVYRAVSTFVMRPRTSLVLADDEVVRMVDTLSRRVEINTTYAEVAESKHIKNLAAEQLGLEPGEGRGISVNGRVIAGTNILEIAVEGPDPQLVRDFAHAVTTQTKSYVSGLYDVFELEPLDAADVPRSPIRPNATLNLILGAMVGLAGGVALAFLSVYLLEPAEEPVTFDIIDYETGAYTESYLKLRLWQEMRRAARNGYHFSLVLIRVERAGLTQSASAMPSPLLRKISGLLRSCLRDEDLLGRLDPSTFALLLPDLNTEEATPLVDELVRRVETAALDIGKTGSQIYLHAVSGSATYDDYSIGLDDLLLQAANALHTAEKNSYQAVHLFYPDKDLPHRPEAGEAIGGTTIVPVK